MTNNTHIHLAENEFFERFRPIRNHLVAHVPFDGCMFETFGAEADFVRAQDAALIWTVVDCDGEMLIESGVHFVNRLGYLIASLPREADRSYTVGDELAAADTVIVNRAHLRAVLDYLHDSEADHYDPETYPDDVNDHVYAHVLAIEEQLKAGQQPADRDGGAR